MQFYPNNISITEVGFAVSASFARSSSLIETFTAVPVTASLALNITGSTGTNGTSAGPIAGPKGEQGLRGVTGPRGNSVYLLSSSWHDSGNPGAACGTPPQDCWSVDLYAAYNLFGSYTCDFSLTPGYNPARYYTTSGSSQALVDANFGAGFPLYANETCTDPLAPILAPYVTFPAALGAHAGNGQNKVYGVTSLSTSSFVDNCGSGGA